MCGQARWGCPTRRLTRASPSSASFSIIDNGTAVAGIQAPLSNAVTTLTSRNAGFTTGTIALTLASSPLLIGSTYPDHLLFSQFTYDLTTTNGSTFLLSGNASAVTDTPLGQVYLQDINFLVPAGLIGLEKLAVDPTLILSVDVTGGTADGIELNITGQLRFRSLCDD